jgi:hypothetical protein
VVAEYDDGALMKIAAADGLGVLPIPTVAERDAVGRYGLARVGRTETCRQEFFAISVERKLTHPAVVAITSSARESLFGAPGRPRFRPPTSSPPWPAPRAARSPRARPGSTR